MVIMRIKENPEDQGVLWLQLCSTIKKSGKGGWGIFLKP